MDAKAPAQRHHGPRCELGAWLSATTDTTREYFERCIDLYGHLCAGRNLSNTPSMRELLPYKLAMSIITNERLDLVLRSKIVSVVQDMYIDADPHDACAEIRLLRNWNAVEEESKQIRALVQTEVEGRQAGSIPLLDAARQMRHHRCL